MNTWIISTIITNRASDRYSKHSKCEYHKPHKDSCDWQDWGLTLEALPLRGGGSAGRPKKDKRRVRRGSREQKKHITHKPIWTKKSSVNPKSTSNQSSKPCTVLKYPSSKVVLGSGSSSWVWMPHSAAAARPQPPLSACYSVMHSLTAYIFSHFWVSYLKQRWSRKNNLPMKIEIQSS